MKHTITTLLTILCSATFCFAQTNAKPRYNVLSFELGKNGLICNLNYDHKFTEKNFGFRFGAGSNFAQQLSAMTVGGGGYYLVGKQNRFLELGIDLQYLVVDEVSDDQKGVSLVYPDYPINTFYPSLNIGYRSYGKGTLFRVGASPCVIDSKFVPGAYISFGFRF